MSLPIVLTSGNLLRRLRRRLRTMAGIVLTLFFSMGSLDAQSGNWPGWRGDGSGVSPEVGLPVEWHELGYRWRTPIEGTGSSSPIVWDDQVFLTTSVARPLIQFSDLALRWVAALGVLIIAFTLLVALVPLVRGRRRSDPATRAPTWLRWLAATDAVAVVALTGYFCWSVADLLLRRRLQFSPEQPDVAWILCGETAVLGLLAATGGVGGRSWWRLIGLVLLAGAGGSFYFWQPPTVATMPVPLGWQMNVFAPLAIGMFWLLVVWLAECIRQPPRGFGLPKDRAARSLALTSVALLTFAYFNVVEPRLGIVREVWAFDRNTGEVAWRTGVAAPSGRKWSLNTYATPTPVTDGRTVVADFGPIMVAIDTQGEIIWQREEPLYVQFLRYGSVRSPVIYEDTVIYLYLPENPRIEQGAITGDRGYLAAFDLATGEEVWRVDGIAGGHDSYTSPLLVPLGEDRASIVVSVYDHVHGYDADTGRHLWSFESPMAHPVPSHVADDRTVYAGGGLYGPQLAAAIDLGPFAAADMPSNRPDSGPVSLQARWTTNRQTPDISSLLVYQGLVYWVASDGRMLCHDADTGEVVWRRRLAGVFEPSPVAGDGKIYVQATDGRTIVLAAGRTFEQLSENRLFEFGDSHASIAIAGRALFIRGADHLFSVGGGSSETTQ